MSQTIGFDEIGQFDFGQERDSDSSVLQSEWESPLGLLWTPRLLYDLGEEVCLAETFSTPSLIQH